MLKKYLFLIFIISVLFHKELLSQDSVFVKILNANSKSYLVNQAVEVESLFPMFFYGGYHLGAGYRYKKFRVRVSVINSGSYDAEPAGINNGSRNFKRFYLTSPGIFFGYNFWKNFDIYSFIESHTFKIEQKSTGLTGNLHSYDFGGGIGYQLFLGKYIYLQPALHIYCRKEKLIPIGNEIYNIPKVDISPVIRLGVRLWSKYPEN
jgi:hypothetical protein